MDSNVPSMAVSTFLFSYPVLLCPYASLQCRVDPGRCRIVGFNARSLVFYVNIGGNIETPPKNLMELPRGHFLGSFLGHKKVPSRDLSRAQKKYPRDLFRAQKSTLGDLFREQKSTLIRSLKSAPPRGLPEEILVSISSRYPPCM